MNQQEMFGRAVWLDAGCGEDACSRRWDAETASWVELGKQDEMQSRIWILRGRFSVGKVRRAMLRVLGLGFFHCYINGKRVGEDLFLPLSTDFEPRKDYPIGEILSGHRICVPEYDVASYLCEGENVIAIHFGGGWYANVRDVKYGDAKAIWRVFGEDESGAFDFVSSEADRIGESYVCDYLFTTREMHDYRLQDESAWGKNFDDGGWKNAVCARPLETEYVFSDCPADVECEMLPVRKIGENGGTAIYDCGRNTSGYPVLKLCGGCGEEVRVRFSEELDEDGMPAERFGHGQQTTFVSDGKERTVSPLFTWFGFRYFAVSGDAEPVGVQAVHSNIAVTAAFESDCGLLNWIHDTYVNTQLTNMHAGIPSDCPHIERRGYTGDGQLTCHAAMNILDAKAFYGKWIQDIADCQDLLTGHVQYTAPYIRSGGGPGGWGCAIVEVPYQYYLHYGDAEVLRKYYPAMLRYFDYLEAHSYNDLVVSDKAGEWCLGDWCPPISVVLPAPFVNNYFYIKSLKRCIEIARLIGRDEDIVRFEQRIEVRKKAIDAAYFNIWDGNYLGNQQGANAFAVDIGLGDARTYPNMVKYYQKLKRFDTGIFGTDIVSRVMLERGDGQTAMDLLLSSARTSFDGMRKLGATTFWEYWPDSLIDRSHNHPMFGAVVAYLYDYLLGIRPQEGSAGYERIVVAPVLVDGINRISGSRMLPAGRVSVAYQKEEGRAAFTIVVPEGVEAQFVLGERVEMLCPGESKINC